MGGSAERVRAVRGFTLVELLIVVIILAILAAVVVPQFVATTDDAKNAALDTTLVNMRAAMDLYYQQHSEFPSAIAAGGAFGAIDTNLAFVNQLAKYTDDDGAVSNTKDTTFRFGPYLRKDSLPTEPLTDSSALVIITAGALGAVADAGDPGGWKFDNVTGQFFVNDQNYDDR